MTYPTKVNDYYRKPVKLKSESDLYVLYRTDSKKQADVWAEKTNQAIIPDSFYEWMLKRGVCPYGVISSNTRYWLELMAISDGEMGLTMPLNYNELPALFFEALRIHRENNRSEEKEVKSVS